MRTRGSRFSGTAFAPEIRTYTGQTAPEIATSSLAAPRQSAAVQSGRRKWWGQPIGLSRAGTLNVLTPHRHALLDRIDGLQT